MTKAEELFGKEQPINIDTSDSIFQYYYWLRNVYGLSDSPKMSYKCPFYQFLFWGSLFLIPLFPFFILGKFIQYVVIKPSRRVIPRIVVLDEYFSHNLLWSSIGSGCVITIISLIFSYFSVTFLLEILFKFGWALHILYASPFLVLFAILKLPWKEIGHWSLVAIIVIGISGFIFWGIYRLSLLLFNNKFFKKLIANIFKPVVKNGGKQKKETISRKKKVRPIKVKTKDHIISDKIVTILAILSRILMKIEDIIGVLWMILTETISNHCPPIYFTENLTVIGTFGTFHDLDKELLLFYYDDYRILIPNNLINFHWKQDKKYILSGAATVKDVPISNSYGYSPLMIRTIRSIDYIEEV